MRACSRWVWLWLAVVLAGLLASCGGGRAGIGRAGAPARRPALAHQADTNADGKILIDELTVYIQAWKQGQYDDINLLTNGIALWKGGETYTYDPTLSPPYRVVSTTTNDPPTPTVPHPSPAERHLDLLASSLDWRAQDHATSRGVTAVRTPSGWTGLILDTALDGNDAARRQGEVLLDLTTVQELGGLAPLNLANTVFSARVWVPQEFVGNDTSHPNGLQLFVKDDQFRSQYGAWVNVGVAGEVAWSHRIEARSATATLTEAGFDPTRIATIGVKAAIGTGSVATCKRPLGVVDLQFQPEVATRAKPSPPAPSPRTSLVGMALTAQPDGLYANGQKVFVVGGNYRAVAYSQNFGLTAWFPFGNGISQHRSSIKAELAELRLAGVQWLRVGLTDDGAALFDAAGNVTGYGQAFIADVQTLLDTADSANLVVEFVLADFHLADQATTISGVTKGGRAAVFTNPTLRTGFVTNFLTPLLQRFGSHRALAAIDAVNEPEWFIAQAEGGSWENGEATKPLQPVPLADCRAYVNACQAAVHTNAARLLFTVGVSANRTGLVAGLPLDYTAVHYYDGQGQLSDLVSGFAAGQPWLLEEFASNGGAAAVTAQLTGARALGASGGLLWNLTPASDSRTMSWAQRNGVLEALATWQ